MTVAERLAESGSEKYRDFQSKLVPNIPKKTILGVKTPDMRKIAKEIRGTEEAEAFRPPQYICFTLFCSINRLNAATWGCFASNCCNSLIVIISLNRLRR